MEEKKEKRIEVIKLKVSEINTGFGNPRKIKAKNKEELKESLTNFGDFGLVLVDEKYNVIAGNQRVSILKEENPDTEVLCKMLVGYSEAELRAINIKDNTHSGEWDLEALADWTADLNIDLGIDLNNSNPNDRVIPEMELIHYEKYDYVLLVCRSVLDYNDLIRKLNLEDKKINIAKKRKINARAIWYDKMPATIVPNDRLAELEKAYKELEELKRKGV